MGEWKSAAHVRYDLWYHFVWTPKYRKRLLAEKERKGYLYRVLKEIGARYEFEISRVAVDDDHVHVFLSAPPRYSPSQIAGVLKGITAREMFKAFPVIKRALWGGEFWEDGYSPSSSVIKQTLFVFNSLWNFRGQSLHYICNSFWSIRNFNFQPLQ